MELIHEMNYFYYKMALYELQIMNNKDYYNGLSYNSMLYINVIAQYRDCTVSKLSEALHVTKSAVTLKVNELVKAGAVHKVQSEEDKRVFYVRLSSKVERTLGLYDDIFKKIEEDLQTKYTQEELRKFNQILHTISNFEWRKIKNE